MSLMAMTGFLVLKEGTKGIKAKPYKTKSGIEQTADRSRMKHIV